ASPHLAILAASTTGAVGRGTAGGGSAVETSCPVDVPHMDSTVAAGASLGRDVPGSVERAPLRRGPVGNEVRIALRDDTSVWHGGRGGPAALRPGRSVIIWLGEEGQSAG